MNENHARLRRRPRPATTLPYGRNWRLIGSFNESEHRHLTSGSLADVYLLSAPSRHFVGKIQGIRWCVGVLTRKIRLTFRSLFQTCFTI
jgi:hypothetical protein